LSNRLVTRLDALPPDRRPLLSAISLWEAAILVDSGRIECRPTFDAWMMRATDPATIHLLPISPEIAMEVARLPSSFRRDPADRLIVATARVHHLAVVTADRAILDSKLVRAWRG
jgi:PIN domain nuclease of toxin-antitoxin system